MFVYILFLFVFSRAPEQDFLSVFDEYIADSLLKLGWEA